MAGNAIQTQNQNIENLKASYLAVYQSIQLTKTRKSEAQQADDERKCSYLKFATWRASINAGAGSCLQDELERYAQVVDSPSGLNNYWKQFGLLNVETDNNPLEWKWTLHDPNSALQHVKPLCCNEKLVLDKDVEQLSSWWKQGQVSPRTRKISRQQQDQVVVTTEQHVDLADKSRQIHRQYQPIIATEQMPDLQKSPPTRKQVNTANGSKLSLHNLTARHKRPLNAPAVAREKVIAGKQLSRTAASAAVARGKQSNEQEEEEEEEEKKDDRFSGFATARAVLSVQQANKNNNKQQQTTNRPQHQYQNPINQRQQPAIKKSLGGKRSGTGAVNSPFVCPFKAADNQAKEAEADAADSITDERLKGIEPKMIELIRNEIMDCGNPIEWDDIAGLETAKRIIKEIVVYPMRRPDIFTGLRRPPKGILLFGPPGTGKTLIGKCIASQSKSTFFSISASSLTSKWVGEGEKMVRALFAVAQVEQPSVVFIDEIDSLLCQRSETEHESSRRMKTEFLVQLDGAATGEEDRILVIGATNRPYELDEAARRRLVKRLYVPLPELEARKQIVRNLLKSERNDLTDDDVHAIAKLADGYSGADMTNLCKEASMGPIRSIPFDQLENISTEDVRRVTFRDFQEALAAVRPSVSQNDLSVYIEWDRTYGTASAQARN